MVSTVSKQDPFLTQMNSEMVATVIDFYKLVEGKEGPLDHIFTNYVLKTADCTNIANEWVRERQDLLPKVKWLQTQYHDQDEATKRIMLNTYESVKMTCKATVIPCRHIYTRHDAEAAEDSAIMASLQPKPFKYELKAHEYLELENQKDLILKSNEWGWIVLKNCSHITVTLKKNDTLILKDCSDINVTSELDCECSIQGNCHNIITNGLKWCV
jgi:hypothetical protein